MKRPFSALFLGAAIISSPLVAAAPEIPNDTPVSQLLKDATRSLATGANADALFYLDAAISKDPQNYLSVFKRGAAYLSLGKSSQAERDFDRVLELKPGFEGALLQRAKIRSRQGRWEDAKTDYLAAGKRGGQEVEELEQAQGAAILADTAANASQWDECISQAGLAIVTAGALTDLRRLRARCRFEKGEVAEGISDLQHVVQLSTGSTEPHMQISAMSFYSLGETDKGLAQVRKCLQSDPDSKDCRKLMRREKAFEKEMKKLRQAQEKKTFATAARILVGKGSEEEPGLIKMAKDDTNELKEEGSIHKSSPDGLYAQLVEQACEAYIEMNNYKRASSYCTEILTLNPTSLPGLLSKAKASLDAEDYQAAINTLNEAKEHHGGGDSKLNNMLNEAHTLLKRSKQKDYYKVLGLSRDADEREIKRAFRRQAQQHHPDKAAKAGVGKEEAEKKMAQLNEAYEVLSDPELKARFDAGDDPNDPEGQARNPFQGSPFGGGQQQFFFQQGGGGGFPGGGSFQFQGGFPFG